MVHELLTVTEWTWVYNQTWAYRTNIFLFVVTLNMFDRYHCDSGKDGPVPFSLCTSSSFSELANHQTYH